MHAAVAAAGRTVTAVLEGVEATKGKVEDARSLVDSSVSLVDPFLSDSGLASLEVARTATEFVTEVSKSVVDALLRVAERVPLAGHCAGVLKDIFGLYEVWWRSGEGGCDMCVMGDVGGCRGGWGGGWERGIGKGGSKAMQPPARCRAAHGLFHRAP